MPPALPFPLPRAPRLSETDSAALTDLFVAGTPANTLRAYERDLIYLTAWKRLRFGQPLGWPEAQDVALTFLLDHARDLTAADATDPARATAAALMALDLRRSLACPAPSSLDRRVASWRAFHRMKNLDSPFDAPLIRQTRAKARKSAARPPSRKSPRPITRALLEQLLDACGPTLRGTRDRAILMLGWASGGRRRSEIVALHRADVSLDDFERDGLVWIQLVDSKTTLQGKTPKLVLKGRAAQALVAWTDAAAIDRGPLFRAISKSGRVLDRNLSAAAISQILKRRLGLAGLPADYATPHGLRSGFLTQAALDGAPIQAAMRLSLHRSVAQAQQYYDDVEITDNPATDLLG